MKPGVLPREQLFEELVAVGFQFRPFVVEVRLVVTHLPDLPVVPLGILNAKQSSETLLHLFVQHPHGCISGDGHQHGNTNIAGVIPRVHP
eukprot:Skav216538  [mRNA]  locus=scaffold1776:86282:88337:- [translate_table: standard]